MAENFISTVLRGFFDDYLWKNQAFLSGLKRAEPIKRGIERLMTNKWQKCVLFLAGKYICSQFRLQMIQYQTPSTDYDDGRFEKFLVQMHRFSQPLSYKSCPFYLLSQNLKWSLKRKKLSNDSEVILAADDHQILLKDNRNLGELYVTWVEIRSNNWNTRHISFLSGWWKVQHIIGGEEKR